MKRKRATHRNQAYDHGVFFVNDSNEYYITYRELVKQLEENIRLRAENQNLMHHLEAQIVGDLAARKTLCEQSDKYKDERDEARLKLAKIDKLVDFAAAEPATTSALTAAQIKAIIRG